MLLFVLVQRIQIKNKIKIKMISHRLQFTRITTSIKTTSSWLKWYRMYKYKNNRQAIKIIKNSLCRDSKRIWIRGSNLSNHWHRTVNSPKVMWSHLSIKVYQAVWSKLKKKIKVTIKIKKIIMHMQMIAMIKILAL